MVEKLINEIFRPKSDSEIKAQSAIKSVAEFNNFEVLHTVILHNAFGGFDNDIIANNVSALKSPYDPKSFFKTH